MLTVERLVKSFRGPGGEEVRVLDVGEMRLGKGEQVGLMGTSGTGKTTLLHCLAGILAGDGGSIAYEMDGVRTELVGLSEARRDVFRGRHIGYVFQTHHLLAGFTALENVMLGMSFTGRHVERGWAEHLLERVGLQERLGYRPGKLSVGQQQRVAVARALANRPGLVLADEPTGALDQGNAEVVLGLMRGLCEEVGATLLLVTHDAGVAQRLPRVMDLREINKPTREGE